MSKQPPRGIYFKTIMKRRICLPFNSVGQNIEHIFLEKISNKIDGVCVEEGYIRSNSIKILHYSSGFLSANGCFFEVVFEADVCSPVEGMLMDCIVKNITKAGIRAEIQEAISPVIIFIARDHNFSNKYFSKVKVDDFIVIKVIGVRYELRDKYISILADLVPKKKKAGQTFLSEKGSGQLFSSLVGLWTIS